MTDKCGERLVTTQSRTEHQRWPIGWLRNNNVGTDGDVGRRFIDDVVGIHNFLKVQRGLSSWVWVATRNIFPHVYNEVLVRWQANREREVMGSGWIEEERRNEE